MKQVGEKINGGSIMLRRFEQFSTAISNIYQSIQKIERIEMAKYGLKGSHTQCMIVMQNYPEGITASRLCEVCDKDKAAISRTIAELEERGLVERKTKNGNAYRASLVLTEAGLYAANQISYLAATAAEKAGADLTEEQREQFYGALSMIANNLSKLYKEGVDSQAETK